jgi:hypothetical protein
MANYNMQLIEVLNSFFPANASHHSLNWNIHAEIKNKSWIHVEQNHE